MGVNRIQNGSQPITKVVIVQTPMGVLKLALPVTPGPDGQDPVAVAMGMFQSAVERGADDPLQETLAQLKEMANAGTAQPLVMGLAILKQMAENGMLPPLHSLIEGTGITPADIETALGTPEGARPGILDKLDSTNPN
jgi:hypothetical protein